MNNLRLYKIDIEYIKYLYFFDNRIQYNPNQPDEYTITKHRTPKRNTKRICKAEQNRRKYI